LPCPVASLIASFRCSLLFGGHGRGTSILNQGFSCPLDGLGYISICSLALLGIDRIYVYICPRLVLCVNMRLSGAPTRFRHMPSIANVSLSHLPVIARLMRNARHVLGKRLQLSLSRCLRAWRGSVKSPSPKQSGQPNQADELAKKVPGHSATHGLFSSSLNANLNFERGRQNVFGGVVASVSCSKPELARVRSSVHA
jgi:hypothetical protein